MKKVINMNNKKGKDINMVHIPVKMESEFLEKDYTLFKLIAVIFAVGAVSVFLIG